ncbi:hypothetical protein POF45_00910 [Pseudomonas sp. 681]|uniref:Uncharacterized protein n=1 Tax=Pseudomonas fungipugnans TaxID=3024217 RepID=A0ABT6QGI4_9PSED|nr:hypothetical protein [Pseudomonas sp. 681]MDI2589992.1 hypothetical protein [Pseudomonas sp. 681]
MNEAQTKQIQDIVQDIATDESISFDEAFAIAMGMLKFHADGMPKGRKAFGCGG